jgi:hypothetical protein
LRKRPCINLALGQADAGLRRPADEPFFEACAQLKRTAEDEVAGHQRVGETVLAEGGVLPAPCIAVVDNVVVQQCRRMDELEGGGHVDDVIELPEFTLVLPAQPTGNT